MTDQFFRSELAWTNAEIADDPGESFQALFTLHRKLQAAFDLDPKVVSQYHQPCVVLGTGDLQGQAWPVPARVMLVARTAGRGGMGIERGRGVCLRDAGGRLEFYTELEEAFLDLDKTDTQQIADLLAKWVELLRAR